MYQQIQLFFGFLQPEQKKQKRKKKEKKFPLLVSLPLIRKEIYKEKKKKKKEASTPARGERGTYVRMCDIIYSIPLAKMRQIREKKRKKRKEMETKLRHKLFLDINQGMMMFNGQLIKNQLVTLHPN